MCNYTVAFLQSQLALSEMRLVYHAVSQRSQGIGRLQYLSAKMNFLSFELRAHLATCKQISGRPCKIRASMARFEETVLWDLPSSRTTFSMLSMRKIIAILKEDSSPDSSSGLLTEDGIIRNRFICNVAISQRIFRIDTSSLPPHYLL